MFRNYLKIAIRHVKKNRGFALLNVLGLSLGLTCAILILLWIKDEVTYNSVHEKYDTLYQVEENQAYDGRVYTFAATPGLLAAAMKADFPEVKETCRMGWGNRWLFTVKDKPIYEDGNFADPAFFRMFSITVVKGDKNNPLPDEHSIVITEKTAAKFFDNGDPLGQYVKVNEKGEFRITAVVKDPPRNSSFRFGWLAHFKVFEKENPWWNTWDNNGMQTFAELVPGTDVPAFNAKFRLYIKGKKDDATAQPFLHAMKDWRLRSNWEEGKQVGGRIEYVRLFGTIAAILIVIACINFMNLATARSEQRAREVGVRKVMGALRTNLVVQFIGESVVMAFFAMMIALLLVTLFLPSFNELVGKKLELDYSDGRQWLAVFAIALLSGIIAGSYPAFFLSSFKPVSIFKGVRSGKNSGAVLVRKGLVITQFITSIVLIISTVVIYKQIEHVKNRQLGFDRENLIYLEQNQTINKKQDLITTDLIAGGFVTHAATCSQRVIQMGSNTGGFNWKGKDISKDVLISIESVSPDYVPTVGMKLVAGRNFFPDAAKDSSCVIINETLARIMGAVDPVNMQITRDSTTYTVVGVVKDFIYNDMYRKPDPALFFCDPRNTGYMFIRLAAHNDMEAALESVGAVFRKHNPGYPFEYNFLDADFEAQFKSEMLVSRLSRLFAILTIVVSCLGLFGLAAYTAERRTREIEIRKVLGATVQNLVALLSADFVRLVLIAIVIATPLAWFIMNNWLNDYEYRIDVKWWMLLFAGAGALLLSVVTVSFQAIKAALTNPVKSLRTE